MMIGGIFSFIIFYITYGKTPLSVAFVLSRFDTSLFLSPPLFFALLMSTMVVYPW